jgi:hypothetical protein
VAIVDRTDNIAVRISRWAEFGIVGGEDGRLSIDLRRTA